MSEKQFKIKIKDEEVGMALDFLRGVDTLESFRQWYPNATGTPDNRARYRAKEILKRPHVQAYIDHQRDSGESTDEISEIAIKKYLWETALQNKGTQVGLRAAQTLGKEFGIGTETVVIKSESSYDKILEAINEYNEALMKGLNPPMPQCLLDNEVEAAESVDFEIMDGEDDDE